MVNVQFHNVKLVANLIAGQLVKNLGITGSLMG